MADNDAAGSSAGLDAGDHATTDAKIDVARDGTPSSMESTPEADGGNEVQEPAAQPQKRKGGRKPIYATSEERKQRNRQAQAAFRERRTEYIKQLEATIKQNEDTLGTLQQSHRSAADECLMLRYKNSLLERILLEKGIDVQTELQNEDWQPCLPPWIYATTHWHGADAIYAATPAACCNSEATRSTVGASSYSQTGTRTILGSEFSCDLTSSRPNALIPCILAIQFVDPIPDCSADWRNDPTDFRHAWSTPWTTLAIPSLSAVIAEPSNVPASATCIEPSTLSAAWAVPIQRQQTAEPQPA